MQKIAVALVQVALVVVAVHAMACATAQPAQTKTAASLDPQVALRERLAALEAKGPLQFETDTDVLTVESKGVLREVAWEMFEHPRTRVIVTGHADERGDTAYNLALGERRGAAAREYLSKLGVPAGRVRIVSLGEEAPLNVGHDEAAWAENRRDEFTFLVPSQLAQVQDNGEALLVARVVFDDEN